MGGLYYNLALRNSDVGNKDSEKLYYCVLKNRGMVDQETFVNYLSQISGVQDALCLAVVSKLGAAITNFLQDGQSVDIPRYDFISGKRQWHESPLQLSDRSVLVVEGIHGLNPELTASVPDKMKYRIYVSAPFASARMSPACS